MEYEKFTLGQIVSFATYEPLQLIITRVRGGDEYTCTYLNSISGIISTTELHASAIRPLALDGKHNK